MSQTALLFALVAMLSWGVWALLANLATRTLAPEIAMIISYASSIAIAAAYVGLRNETISLGREGALLALAAGVFGGVGAVAFYAGLEAGRTGIITTVSALYFVVAAILGVAVLGESLAWNDALGVGFAVLAVLLISQ